MADRLARLWLAMWLSIMPSFAFAHPHAFIDLRTTLELNAQGALTAIREQWTFDQYYTEFALHDFGYKPGGALDQAKILELAHENLKGLKEFQYFTKLSDPGSSVQTATAVKSYLADKRIVMEFTVPLTKPLAAPFSLQIYDPSYYTAMIHKNAGVEIVSVGPAICTSRIVKANPDIVWTSLASSLDRNATAPEDLGKFFAETVSVTCK